MKWIILLSLFAFSEGSGNEAFIDSDEYVLTELHAGNLPSAGSALVQTKEVAGDSASGDGLQSIAGDDASLTEGVEPSFMAPPGVVSTESGSESAGQVVDADFIEGDSDEYGNIFSNAENAAEVPAVQNITESGSESAGQEVDVDLATNILGNVKNDAEPAESMASFQSDTALTAAETEQLFEEHTRSDSDVFGNLESMAPHAETDTNQLQDLVGGDSGVIGNLEDVASNIAAAQTDTNQLQDLVGGSSGGTLTPAETTGTLTEAQTTQDCSRGAMVDDECSIYLKYATPSEIEAAFAQRSLCPS